MRNGIIGAAIAVVVALSLFVAYDQLQGDTPVPPAPAPASAPAAPAPRPAEPDLQTEWLEGHDLAYQITVAHCNNRSHKSLTEAQAGRSPSFTTGFSKGMREAAEDFGFNPAQCSDGHGAHECILGGRICP